MFVFPKFLSALFSCNTCFEIWLFVLLPTNSQLVRFFSVKQVNYRSIITSVFDGKLLSSVQCLTCNRVGYTAEAYPEPCQTSQIERFVKTVYDQKPWIIFHLRCLTGFWIRICIIVLRNLMFLKYEESWSISVESATYPEIIWA